MKKQLIIYLAIGVTIFLNGCSVDDGFGTVKLSVVASEDIRQGMSATFGISRISVSRTGEQWTIVDENIDNISVSAGSQFELIEAVLFTGEYHGVKIDLKPGFSMTMEDSSVITQDYPDVVLYIEGGMYRYSGSGNGYPDTNEYYMFTTRNGALSAPIQVDVNEDSFIVLTICPMYLPGDGTGLAIGLEYTSFLY